MQKIKTMEFSAHSSTCIKQQRIKRLTCIKRSVVKVPNLFPFNHSNFYLYYVSDCSHPLLSPNGLFILFTTLWVTALYYKK